MWLVVGQSLLSIFSGIAVALATHWLSSRREKGHRKRKILGWLRCLDSYLNEIEKGVLEPNKTQWWANYVQLEAGDTFDVFSKKDFEKMQILLSRAWEIDILTSKGKIAVSEPRGEIFLELDMEKLKSMRNLIKELINSLS